MLLFRRGLKVDTGDNKFPASYGLPAGSSGKPLPDSVCKSFQQFRTLCAYDSSQTIRKCRILIGFIKTAMIQAASSDWHLKCPCKAV